jgi:hypothetical protein
MIFWLGEVFKISSYEKTGEKAEKSEIIAGGSE